jgi:hypothetical protein
MSPPLISYHVNGTMKSEGLKSLGLVELTNNNGKVGLSISSLGMMLIKGYIKSN